MKTLMTNLEAIGFTKQNGLNGLSFESIEVSLHWSGEEAVVAIDGKQVFSSDNEAKIVDFIKAELAKKAVSKTENSRDAEVLAAEVAKDSEIIKYYADEDKRGKSIMIKDALLKMKEELPKSINFSDFQKLVESNI